MQRVWLEMNVGGDGQPAGKKSPVSEEEEKCM